ncbi:hypothetical protein DFJ73DRAFT_569558 [Zopfochytrium polystomum]|nr:hypothetical protein DFJ73DRAFT_569558 [Zopfochytrium polystomum]
MSPLPLVLTSPPQAAQQSATGASSTSSTSSTAAISTSKRRSVVVPSSQRTGSSGGKLAASIGGVGSGEGTLTRRSAGGGSFGTAGAIFSLDDEVEGQPGMAPSSLRGGLDASALGVKAEPRSPKATTALAGLSSLVTGISSLINSAPASDNRGFDSSGGLSTANRGPQRVTCSKFSWVNWEPEAGIGRSARIGLRAKRLWLLVGYEDGFQIWDVTDLDDVREIYSIRNPSFQVADLEAVPHTPFMVSSPTFSEELAAAGPLLAFGVDPASETGKTRGSLHFYSLTQGQVFRTFTFEGSLHAIKCSERFIVASMSTGHLHAFSALTLAPIAVFQDTSLLPGTDSAVFDVGCRYLVYASNSPPPSPKKRTDSTTIASDLSSSDSEEYEREVGTMENIGKVAGKVAGMVAKEFIGGVKVFGEYGYNALSNYFSAAPGQPSTGAPPPSSYGPAASQTPKEKRPVLDGVVVIHDIENPNPIPGTSPNPAKPLPLSHWKPHSNAVSFVGFNPSQTLLVTASTHGTTFNIYEVPSRISRRNGAVRLAPRTPRCIYKLERGFTSARIESINFSLSSEYVAVSTARGTTHVYQIDPAAGVNPPNPGSAAYEIWVLNGWAEARPATDAASLLRQSRQAQSAPSPGPRLGTSSGGPGGANAAGATPAPLFPRSIYPVARIKQRLPLEGGDSSGTAAPVGRERRPSADPPPRDLLTGAASDYVAAKLSRAALSMAFVVSGSSSSTKKSSSKSAKLQSVGGLYSTSPVGGGALQLPSAGHSGGGSSGPGSAASFAASMVGAAQPQVRVHRQRVIVFHPSGVLQLHNIDFNVSAAGSEATPPHSSSGQHFSTGSPTGRGGAYGKSPSPRDRMAVPVTPLGKSAGVNVNSPSDVKVSVKEVVEWSVCRDREWREVKSRLMNTLTPASKGKPADPRSWASQIEISTFDPLSFGPPLWLGPSLTFHVYQEGTTRDRPPNPEDRRGKPDLWDMPRTTMLEVGRKTATPYSAPGTKASDFFPVVRGRESVANDISSAMFDPLDRDGAVEAAQRWQRARAEELSFEDALVVDDTDEFEGFDVGGPGSGPDVPEEDRLGLRQKQIFGTSAGATSGLTAVWKSFSGGFSRGGGAPAGSGSGAAEGHAGGGEGSAGSGKAGDGVVDDLSSS